MENKSFTDKLLTFIKLNNEVTAAQLAEEFDMTKEGARKHLLKLEQQNLVSGLRKSEGVGRPTTYYALSEKGLETFPDSHAKITVELLRSVKQLLGDNALDLLISDREQQSYSRYKRKLAEADNLESRLDKLAKLRTEEGYMANWKKEEDEYFLIENHCPICSAAKECQGFCRAELKTFRQLIGKEYKVERVKHIMKDEHRCVYKIKPEE